MKGSFLYLLLPGNGDNIVVGTVCLELLCHNGHWIGTEFFAPVCGQKCHSTGLREYRRVVFYFSFLNILFLFVQALNQPLILNGSNKLTYISLSGPIAQIPSFALWEIFDLAYFTLVNLIMAGLAMQFVERYLVICRNHQNAFGRNLMLGGFLCFYSGISMFSQLLGMQNGVNLEDLNEPIFAGAENLTKNIKIIGLYDPANSTLTCIFLGVTSFMMFCYLAIIICYLRIRAFLKANMLTDGEYRKTLKRIIRSMLFQAFVPMYSIGIGVFMLGVSLIANFGSSMFAQYFLVSLASINWLPLLNPLVTILTIEEYRRKAIGIFKRKQQTQTPTVPFVKSHT